LTGTLLAFSLVLLAVEVRTPAVIAEGPALTIDACIAVDRATVRQVMELEISDPSLSPASVSVRCVDGAQEIRIRRSASLDHEDVRTIHIAPAASDDTPAERQARSRELALAIAEFVRWPGPVPRSPRSLPAPVPSSPAPVPALAIASTPSVEAPAGRWQLGILCAFEHFSRGQSLLGADLFVTSRLGRRFLAELRIGGRLGGDQSLSGEHLTTRAASVAGAAGVNLWSRGRVFGGALVLRAQGYLVQFRAEATGDGSVETASLGALALGLEPRLIVAVTRRLSLQASAAAGWVPHGIVVRIQGVDTRSMAGMVLSSNLGGVFTF
jgi:hypothetical protein